MLDLLPIKKKNKQHIAYIPVCIPSYNALLETANCYVNTYYQGYVVRLC